MDFFCKPEVVLNFPANRIILSWDWRPNLIAKLLMVVANVIETKYVFRQNCRIFCNTFSSVVENGMHGQ